MRVQDAITYTRLLGGLGGSADSATGGGAARDRWERDVQARAAAASGLPSFPGASDARSDWRTPVGSVVDVRLPPPVASLLRVQRTERETERDEWMR